MEKRVYIINRNSAVLSHAGSGEERKNHKYISREWKNGKWRYEYKDGSRKIDPASREKQFTSQKTSVPKTLIEEASDVKRNFQYQQNLNKNLDKLPASVANKITGKNKPANLYTLKEPEKKSVLSVAKDGMGNALQSVIDTSEQAIKDVKDKLGYDEKSRLEAANDRNNQLRKDVTADRNFVAVRSNDLTNKYGDSRYGEKKEQYQEEYQDTVAPAWEQYEKTLKEKEQAAKDLIKAREEYMNTPLGKIDRINDLVTDGAEAVVNLFKKMIKR